MTNFRNDLICFSHLRWSFVFQRPQHLISRCARTSRVFFLEEPVLKDGESRLETSICSRTGVRVVTPVLPGNLDAASSCSLLQVLVQELIKSEEIHDFVAWYYTPMAIEFSKNLNPALTVYDCMDELSAFANAPLAMLRNEELLFRKADLVFTGGPSLFEAKRSKHDRVYLFPSSVDVTHFAQSLTVTSEPPDQREIPRPRIGYAGVIDERMDLRLIDHLAECRPDWQIILLGPVVKIDPTMLPRRPNIFYPGMKSYDELPAYLSGWNVALLPFAQNEATRFISPTKTPEYLSAGLPVVSTPICDVIRLYGDSGLVRIGRNHEEFLMCVERQLTQGSPHSWRAEVRAFLERQSWDKTWDSMQRLMSHQIAYKRCTVPERLASAPKIACTPEVSAAHV